MDLHDCTTVGTGGTGSDAGDETDSVTDSTLSDNNSHDGLDLDSYHRQLEIEFGDGAKRPEVLSGGPHEEDRPRDSPASLRSIETQEKGPRGHRDTSQ